MMRKIVLTALLASGLGLAPSAHAQENARLLASNCFQCHGTNGKPIRDGFDRLAGQSQSEIFEELMEMRGHPSRVEPEEELMAVHANGFTEAELRLIAKFFSRQ